jgi:hypothetical protein
MMMVVHPCQHDKKKIRDARNFVKRDMAGWNCEFVGVRAEARRFSRGQWLAIRSAYEGPESGNELRKTLRVSVMTLDDDKITLALNAKESLNLRLSEDVAGLSAYSATVAIWSKG